MTSWTTVKGNQPSIKRFSENTNLYEHLKDMANESPAAFYEIMVTDEIFQEIADCTNIFAENEISNNKESSRLIKIHQWIPTNHSEIKKFFGLIMFMGIVKLPRLTDYWSKDAILSHPFPERIMSRDRFQTILQMLHFSVDDETNKTDPSHYTRKLLDALNSNFAKYFSPAEDLFIQKGPLLFCGKDTQTKLPKRTRLVKLCSAPGYVCKVGLFVRKNVGAMNDILVNTVMTLCSDRLNKGHTLYTDDCLTNLDLARKLLENETHLVGYLRKHRLQPPMEVTGAKLEAGSFIARESYDGITVMKLREKEVTLLLSTKHSTQFASKCTKSGKSVIKPQIIIDYEKAEEAVHLCDKIAETSSTCTLLEPMKWYKKLAIDLLLNIAVVNALTLYKSMTNKNIQIVDFRKELVVYLCQKNTNDQEEETTMAEPTLEAIKHKLIKKVGPVRLNRRTCHQCYKDKTKVMGRMLAKNRSPKVATYCENCPNKPFLCLTCFNKTHC